MIVLMATRIPCEGLTFRHGTYYTDIIDLN
jgi:hypothetical protein